MKGRVSLTLILFLAVAVLWNRDHHPLVREAAFVLLIAVDIVMIGFLVWRWMRKPGALG